MFRVLPLSIFILILFASCQGQDQKPPATTLHSSEPMAGDTVLYIGRDSPWNFQSRDILQDSKNNYWFATDGQGVFKSDGKTIIHYSILHGLCSDFVWKIVEGKDGKMWFKTRDGICFFDGSKFETLKAEQSSYFESKHNFMNDDWVVDHYYDGVCLTQFQLPQTSPLPDKKSSLADYAIYCSYKDRKGNLWFGTQSAGVCIYDGKTYTWLQRKELGTAVRSIFEDNSGNIWIGNNGGGLFRYDPTNQNLINFLKSNNSLNQDLEKYQTVSEGTLSRVWTINQDNQGNLWFGTIDSGIWMYNGKTLTNYTVEAGLGINFIWNIYKDRQSQLWFGTDGAGVYTFDGRAFKKYTGDK